MKAPLNGLSACLGDRQYLIEQCIPEKKLQQDRYVLEDLNIDGRQFGYQPVRR